jgi:hypothetical protein
LLRQRAECRLFLSRHLLGALKKIVSDFNGRLHNMATHTHTAGDPYQVAFPNRAVIFSRTSLSILMSGGQGRFKPSPGNFFFASIRLGVTTLKPRQENG